MREPIDLDNFDENDNLEEFASGRRGIREESSGNASQDTDKKSPEEKKRRRKKRLAGWGITLIILVGLYLTAVYSNIPFIAKWRTIYIETAMTTNSHQWLATMFIPHSVIDEVMAKWQADQDAQAELNSTWKDAMEEERSEIDEEAFYEAYWELDCSSFRDYLAQHTELTSQGYDNILIEDLEETLGMKTTQGDPLLVLDTANHLMIVKVSGEGFQGKMAIVKEASQVDLAKSKSLGSYGQEASGFGEQEDALLVVNASGFKDVDGHGSGGQVKGALIIDGVDYGTRDIQGHWKFCGMKNDNRMYISNYPSDSVSEYRWGVEFFPALIIDGESVVDGTYGMGIQPRTAIGQTRNGDVLLLIVDGRQVGYSLGCTVEDCKNILMNYDAYQAMNMDGGSSSVMWYRGQNITKSSSATGRGRYMPDALIVRKKGAA